MNEPSPEPLQPAVPSPDLFDPDMVHTLIDACLLPDLDTAALQALAELRTAGAACSQAVLNRHPDEKRQALAGLEQALRRAFPFLASGYLTEFLRAERLQGELAARDLGEQDQGREHFRAGGYVGTDRFLWGPDGDAAVSLLNGHLEYDPNWVDLLDRTGRVPGPETNEPGGKDMAPGKPRP